MRFVLPICEQILGGFEEATNVVRKGAEGGFRDRGEMKVNIN